jgi:DNA modification methylase
VRTRVIHGDALDVLRALDSDSVDAVVTDPPYGISFMGKQWDQPGRYGSQRRGGEDRPFTAGAVGADHLTTTERSASMHAGKYDLSPSAMASYQMWCAAWAYQCLRVLKPGGHLLSFGGARTWHRLTAGVEDAGFEIRDSIAWLYGSGFPKSMDVSKAIDKAAGAERAVVGSKTGLPGYSLAENRPGGRQAYGEWTDAEAECAITAPATDAAHQWQGWGTALKPAFEPIVVARKPFKGTVAANVQEHGTGALNIDGCRVGDEVITQHGRGDSENTSMSGRNYAEPAGRAWSGRWPTNVVLDDATATELDEQTGVSVSRAGRRNAPKEAGTYGAFAGDDPDRIGHADSGGASRFFPVFRYQAKAPAKERPRVDGVAHPTVKPLELMRWLVRLVTPPDGLVLDPFAGSGTTGEACLLEGFRALLIEREADYLPLIHARLERTTEATA